MQAKLAKLIENKKVLILGFGREGRATYETIRNFFPKMPLCIADQNEDLQNDENLKKDLALSFTLGEKYLDNLSDFDLIIKTPGISLKDTEFYNDARITSQTDLFLQCYADQVIGITGTKGKSTTSSLIYHILQKYTTDVVFVGNIGIPVFQALSRIGDKTLIVCELSSHQLQYIRKSPHVSVLLNVFQEHLDHYRSYEDYQQAKFNIAACQNQNDFIIYNSDNEILNSFISSKTLGSTKIEINSAKAKMYDIPNRKQLLGEHNLLNMMAAAEACKIVGVPENMILEGLSDFKSLPHRLEYVGNYKGIDFYNDSISTIPEASIAALQAIPNVDTLILGGYDRGIDYSILVQYLEMHPVSNLILVGAAGKRIEELIQKSNLKIRIFSTNDYHEVVRLAFEHTQTGKSCVLSPAAASYDMFKNFEERGAVFSDLIKNS